MLLGRVPHRSTFHIKVNLKIFLIHLKKSLNFLNKMMNFLHHPVSHVLAKIQGKKSLFSPPYFLCASVGRKNTLLNLEANSVPS
jgi:hypothetical protein